VRRGEFVILMGPSGCGKTTLLHILGLMMRPSAGTIRLEGADVGALSEGQRTRLRRERIGFVFQRFNLLPILTARGNIELPLRLRGERADGQVSDVLRQVGLREKADSKPRALSMGEQQRVALARAVVARPRLLLADEPTGNLDSANAGAVLDLLADLHRTCGLTTLMITHNEHLATRADRVLFMRDGRIDAGEP
jgi:putative ABC transport system ATP-binding protein